jgi:NodT family efflux transporter outer membrane factor (OMF) lipoprotein
MPTALASLSAGRLAPLIAAMVLAGCASSAGIAPHTPPLDPVRAGLPAAAQPAPVPFASDWWRSFDDLALDALVDRALAGHPDLQTAQARLERAGAAVAGARAAEGPQVNGAVDVTRQRYSEHGLLPPPLAGSTRESATVQATASWELDFFGRQRAELQSALGGERAARAELEAARLLLASRVAAVYVELARLLEQRTVAERSLAQREETLALVGDRVRAGLDTNVELRQGEGALPETRQQIEALDERIALARHALAALTVQPPDALATLSPVLAALPEGTLPRSLPSDLLARRADITAARWRVEAAGQDVQAAKAEFYPSINLVAFAGLSSIGLGRLLEAGSAQGGFGPALRLPIFDSGRLRANLRGKAADVDAAVASYNGALLGALRDVADQLAGQQSIARQQREQRNAQDAAESAYQLALQRYRAGLGSYLVVLSAEGTVLAQRRLGVDLKARALDNQVQLIRALGGGYVAEPVPALASATPQH